MEGLKRILSYVRRGVDDYEMIKEGDKIAVGVSAGKDSLALLCAMAELRRFYPKKYEVVAITVDPQFNKEPGDYSAVEELCKKHNWKLYLPELSLCGDNAAMVGAQGYYEYLKGERADESLNAYPS